MKKVLKISLILVSILFCSFVKGQNQYIDIGHLQVYGKGPWETSGLYTRFPLSAKDSLREPVWNLSQNSAGLYIRFRTNSKNIGAKWKNSNNKSMNHMTATGVRGLDLYTLEKTGWRFVNSGRPMGQTTDAKIISNMDGKMREYMLYLPLYDGIDSLQIRVDSLALFEKSMINSPRSQSPIVFYGTSITQGGCATRPGMSYTSIIERALDCEVLNFGFSGNAKLDLYVAKLLAQIKNPKMYVLDFMPNCTVEDVNERMILFFDILRKAHPSVPIVVVENPIFPHSQYDTSIIYYIPQKNATLKTNFDKLKKRGEKNIYYISAEGLIGTDGDATVDGIHFTDLGYERYAEKILPLLKKLNRR